MAWEATVKSIEKQVANPINIEITVEFHNTETAEKIVRQAIGNDIDDAFIAEWCKKNIEAIQQRDAALPLVTSGNVTPQDRPLTEAQQFAAAAGKLARLKQLVVMGIIAEDSTELAEAIALAKQLYKPGF